MDGLIRGDRNFVVGHRGIVSRDDLDWIVDVSRRGLVIVLGAREHVDVGQDLMSDAV